MCVGEPWLQRKTATRVYYTPMHHMRWVRVCGGLCIQAAKQRELAEEAQMAAEAEAFRKLTILKEREQQRNRAQQRKEVQQQVLKQDEDKKARLAQMYRENFHSNPAESYFAAFGASSR